MKSESAKAIVAELLHEAGITLNGSNPWDMKVHNDNFYSRMLQDKQLGVGEAYMEGWWDCEKVDELVDKVISAKIEYKIKNNPRLLFRLFWHKLFNFQTKHRALEVGLKHYDLGNDLFQKMLDKRMVYTCGYWKNATNLDDAQEAKLDLVCRKLNLKPGMRILDIGCGWGSFLRYAAEKYGISGVGITISKEQADYAKKNCENFPIEIRLQDYRDVNEENKKFDAIMSLGMFEHVGQKNYRIYMETVYKNLHDHGLFLLHTIGGNTSVTTTDEWIGKYIFPNSMLPSVKQIGESIEGLFVMEDWHSFGADYDKTLMAWHENFNKHWEGLKNKYDQVFFRMWNYYLLICAGSFRARQNQLWQIVLSKNGVRDGYHSLR